MKDCFDEGAFSLHSGFPMPTILGSLITSSVPQPRSALMISLSFYLERAYLVLPREEGEDKFVISGYGATMS